MRRAGRLAAAFLLHLVCASGETEQLRWRMSVRDPPHFNGSTALILSQVEEPDLCPGMLTTAEPQRIRPALMGGRRRGAGSGSDSSELR